jgi:hypothetical protein
VQDVQDVADRFIAGSIPSEDFPSWAARALADGLDSPALRELAGLPRAEVREGRELMRQALAELGAVLPSEDASPENLVNYWALRLTAGTVDTVNGVNWILRQAHALDWPDWLNRLHGLASEWDDWPEGRAEIEVEMRAEVSALLASRRSDESPQR